MRSFHRVGALRAGVVLAIVAFVLAACTTAGPSPSQPAGQPQKGGRVIFGDFADAKVLQPVFSNDVPSSDVTALIYPRLLGVDPKTGQPTPDAAEKWDVSADAKTVTFTLRDGLVWSDGSPFSGEDFKLTAQAVMRSANGVRKNIFQDIVGAKDYEAGKATEITGITVSGKTIKVEFTKAFCPALINVGGFRIIPKSVFGKYFDPNDPKKNLDNAPENTKPPLSMGPFVFKEWIPNDHITLVRNDKFWRGAPNLDEVVFKVVPNATALAAALKTGEVDIGSVEPKDRDDLKAAGNLNFFSIPGRGYTYIGWNELRGGKEFFQDKNIRQALSYGLNMAAVIDKILLGEGKKITSHTVPVYWSYDPTGLNTYEFDQKKAQQLIESSGWTKGSDGIYQKGGQKLQFSIVTNSGNNTRETLLQIATEQYKQIGVQVDPKTESFEALVDRLTKSKDAKYADQGGHDYDAVIIGWSLGSDPDGYSIWHSSQAAGGGNNFVGYKNATVDKALEDERSMCTTDQRKAAFKTFDKQLNDDQPYNFGFSANSLIFANNKVQGLAPDPFGGNTGKGLVEWNFEKVWAKQ